ncbi:MAG: ATP-binding protein [Candidatus Neomarinimicrobiota bacterium]
MTTQTNSTTPWYRQVKFWHILLYVLLLLLVLLAGLLEYRSRYRDILNLFQDHAYATVTAISHSGTRQVELTEDLRSAYLDRALDLLNTIDRIDQEEIITSERLRTLINDRNIFQISILDSQGRLLAGIGEFHGRGPGMGQRHLQPLLTGELDTLIVGLPGGGPRWHRTSQEPDARFLVGIRRSRGGAIVSHMTVAAENLFKARTDLEQLLREMLEIEGVAYINLGIPQYPPLFVGPPEIVPEQLLVLRRERLQENMFYLTGGEREFIEVVADIRFDWGAGKIHVGFSTDRMQEMRRGVIIQILLRSGLLTLVVIVSFFLILSRQNTMLLQAEKQRIEQEVQRLEQLNRIQEKQAAVGTLAAGVAHEIRNPLNAIGIIAQRLKREFQPDDAQPEFNEMSGTMISEISRLNRILDNFLNYARPTPLKPVPVAVGLLFEQTVNLFRDQARALQIDLSSTAPPGLELEADPEYLQQALANVVKNGIEAIAGSGEIRLSASGDRDQIIIRVKDTGSGIAPADLNRIFDIFYTTRENGTGIGLAITHKIISDHGGTIEVNSSPGIGTEFILTLPRRRR